MDDKQRMADARRAMMKPKPVKDQCEGTDSLIVFPKEEIGALIESIYHTLEHTTSEVFGADNRKYIMSALKRLEG